MIQLDAVEQERLLRWTVQLQERLTAGGCSDGACILRDNSKGMHTNASCKCKQALDRIENIRANYYRKLFGGK